MKLVLGAQGFLGKAMQKVSGEALIAFGRQEFDLRGEDIPRVTGVDTIINCADYYPGLEATAANQEEVFRVNCGMYSQMFRLAAENQIEKVVTIGTTACYPVIDEPLSEEWFYRENPAINPKMAGYAESRFALLEMAQVWKQMAGIEHAHLVLPNFYGPGDKYEVGRSHLLASWIRDFWAAKQQGDEHIQLWGSPEVRREFIYIEDAARYVLMLASLDLGREVLNVGYGLAPTYGEMAEEVLAAIDFSDESRIEWDESRPSSRQREVLDLSALAPFREKLPGPTAFGVGLRATVDDFLAREAR